jgi:hypothetical protein
MLRDITWKYKLLRQQLWDLVCMPYMSIMRLTKCRKLRSMRGIITSMTMIIVNDLFWVAQKSLNPLLMILKNFLLVQKLNQIPCQFYRTYCRMYQVVL